MYDFSRETAVDAVIQSSCTENRKRTTQSKLARQKHKQKELDM